MGSWFSHLLLPADPLGLALLGLTVGMLGGFYGMGGSWMVTPGLFLLGIQMPTAVGTELTRAGAGALVAWFRHRRFHRIDIRLAALMGVFTAAGVELAIRGVVALDARGWAGPAIGWAYAILLPLLGAILLTSHLRRQRQARLAADDGQSGCMPAPPAAPVHWTERIHRIRLAPMVEFEQANISCSLWLPVSIALITGLLSGFLGIGGSLLRMPALVYLVGCPTYVAVGTDLVTSLVCGLSGLLCYGLRGRVDGGVLVLVLATALPGAYFGGRATRFWRGYRPRLYLAILVCWAGGALALAQLGVGRAAGLALLAATTLLAGRIAGSALAGQLAERRRRRLQAAAMSAMSATDGGSPSPPRTASAATHEKH